MDLSVFKGTRIIVLDIETTDKSTQKARIRELGSAEFVDGKMYRSASALFSGGISELGALTVHGITDESVSDKPTFESKASFAVNFLSNKILVGHNIISFDIPIIQKCIWSGCQGKIKGDGPNGEIRAIDTLRISRKLFPTLPSKKLSDLCTVFGIEHGQHRGLGDSMSCWYLLLKIIESSGCKNINDLVTLV